MSETKHTPGPWKASYDRYERKHSFVGDGMWFGKISWTVTSDRNEADARLIAAAPELLDALQHLSDVYEHIWVKMSDGEMAIVRGAWEVAAAAIAKAEGRS